MTNRILDFKGWTNSKNGELRDMNLDFPVAKNRKVNHFSESLLGVAYDEERKEMVKVVDCRIYETDDKAYCCIWIYSYKNNFYAHGSGNAGGWGYHRASASMALMFSNMGLGVNHLDGVGETAMENAISEIMENLGYKTFSVFHTKA